MVFLILLDLDLIKLVIPLCFAVCVSAIWHIEVWLFNHYMHLIYPTNSPIWSVYLGVGIYGVFMDLWLACHTNLCLFSLTHPIGFNNFARSRSCKIVEYHLFCAGSECELAFLSVISNFQCALDTLSKFLHLVCLPDGWIYGVSAQSVTRLVNWSMHACIFPHLVESQQFFQFYQTRVC